MHHVKILKQGGVSTPRCLQLTVKDDKKGCSDCILVKSLYGDFYKAEDIMAGTCDGQKFLFWIIAI